MKECLSCQNRCADCTFCFKKLHDKLAAREALLREVLERFDPYRDMDLPAEFDLLQRIEATLGEKDD